MIDDSPNFGVLFDDKKQLQKYFILDSHISSVISLTDNVVNGETIALAIKFVSKEVEE